MLRHHFILGKKKPTQSSPFLFLLLVLTFSCPDELLCCFAPSLFVPSPSLLYGNCFSLSLSLFTSVDGNRPKTTGRSDHQE